MSYVIDGHIHIERGPYTLDWINEFVKRAQETGVDEIHRRYFGDCGITPTRSCLSKKTNGGQMKR